MENKKIKNKLTKELEETLEKIYEVRDDLANTLAVNAIEKKAKELEQLIKSYREIWEVLVECDLEVIVHPLDDNKFEIWCLK